MKLIPVNSKSYETHSVFCSLGGEGGGRGLKIENVS